MAMTVSTLLEREGEDLGARVRLLSGHLFPVLVQEVGRCRARRSMGISRACMLRWESRQVLPFYPPVLARLDRACRLLEGRCLLPSLCAVDGPLVDSWFGTGSGARLCLSAVSSLDVPGLVGCGVPSPTARRWYRQGLLYPASWSRLDGLAAEALGCGWIEAALACEGVSEMGAVVFPVGVVRALAVSFSPLDTEDLAG